MDFNEALNDFRYVPFHNAFMYVDTYGLPLSMCMDECEKQGARVAADSFVYDAVRAGWSFDKAIAVVVEAWSEKYGAARANSLKQPLVDGCKKYIAGGILERPR